MGTIDSRQHEDYVKAASDQAAVVREQKEQAGEVVEEVLQALSILPQEIMTSSEPVKIGDEAAVANSAVRGRVIELNPKRGEAVLEVKGKRMEIPLSKLLKVTFSPPEPDTLLQKLRRSSTSKLKIEESYRSKLEDLAQTWDRQYQYQEE